MAAVVVGLSVVMAAIAVSRQQAVESAVRAEASKLLALAERHLEDDPTEALAYATASLELADTLEARVFATRALWRGPRPSSWSQVVRAFSRGPSSARTAPFPPSGSH